MIVLRCTNRLLKTSGVAPTSDPPVPRQPLGEWYATLLHLPFKGRSLVVFVHDPSRLTVLAPGRTLRTAVPVFRQRLPALLARLGVPAERIAREETALREVAFAATIDPSLVGSMTHVCHVIRSMAQRARSPDAFSLVAVEDEMAEMPSVVADEIPRYWVRENLVVRTLR